MLLWERKQITDEAIKRVLTAYRLWKGGECIISRFGSASQTVKENADLLIYADTLIYFSILNSHRYLPDMCSMTSCLSATFLEVKSCLRSCCEHFRSVYPHVQLGDRLTHCSMCHSPGWTQWRMDCSCGCRSMLTDWSRGVLRWICFATAFMPSVPQWSGLQQHCNMVDVTWDFTRISVVYIFISSSSFFLLVGFYTMFLMYIFIFIQSIIVYILCVCVCVCVCVSVCHAYACAPVFIHWLRLSLGCPVGDIEK